MEASYELSRKQGFLKKNIEAFVKQNISPRVGEINGTAGFPREILKAMAGNRLLGMLVPKEAGGEGAGFLDFCLVVEGIAGICPASALVCMIQNLGAGLLSREGRADQKEAFLPGLMAGDLVFGYVATSSDVLSLDLLDTPLTLTVEGDRCLVNGPACYVINGDAADVIFAFARNEEADGCFLLEKGAAGLGMGEPGGFAGAEARCTCTAVIEDCSVPETAVLGSLGKGKIGHEGDDVRSSRLHIGHGTGCGAGRPGLCASICGRTGTVRHADPQVSGGANDAGDHGRENGDGQATRVQGGVRFGPKGKGSLPVEQRSQVFCFQDGHGGDHGRRSSGGRIRVYERLPLAEDDAGGPADPSAERHHPCTRTGGPRVIGNRGRKAASLRCGNPRLPRRPMGVKPGFMDGGGITHEWVFVPEGQ